VPQAAHCRAALALGLRIYGLGAGARTFTTGRARLARLARAVQDDPTAHPIAAVRTARTVRFTVALDAIATLPPLPRLRCDRRMELRAAFLACGTIAEPRRGYHLEFRPPDDARAERLRTLLRREGRQARVARRAERPVVYFKDADDVAGVLAAIGAFRAVLAIEADRAEKETTNRIRRLVNVEAANVDRSTAAAAAQADAIATLVGGVGLSRLPAALREIAGLRLEYPTETLAELAARCEPPATKSAVGNRMTALLRRARRATVGPSATAQGTGVPRSSA